VRKPFRPRHGPNAGSWQGDSSRREGALPDQANLPRESHNWQSVRETAIRAYHKWSCNPTRIDAIAERALERGGWEARDKGLFLELLYGVIRQHGRLNWIITNLSTSREEPDPAGVAAVAVGIYQLYYLDRVPDFAAVNETVGVAKKLGGPRLAGWVNAVLRRASFERESWLEAAPPIGRTGPDKTFSIKYSHPDWMVTRWLSNHPVDVVERFLIWNNRRPSVTLRVNRLKSSPEEVIASLERAGLTPHPTHYDPYFLNIDHPGDLRRLPEIKEGLVSVQDLSQGLVARILDAKPGEEILDLCAAPGGKTTHLAELAPEASITSTDKSEERLDYLRTMISRMGYKNVSVSNYDIVLSSKRQYDAVLVDAPCTGTGVLSRRPDLRWRRQPDEVRRMAAVQLSLLHYAADRLKPGGRIVYSTCSIEPEENRDLIRRFTEDRRDFTTAPISVPLPEACGVGEKLELLGPEIGADGVFATILKRRS